MTHRSAHATAALLLAVLNFAAKPSAATGQIAVLSNVVEEKVASPGMRYTGTIVIENASPRAQMARIYQTDYRFAADGTSHFDAPGSTARSNATWISLQATHVTVAAGQRISVSYTVTVPAGDSLTGTYWSAVMVEGEGTTATAGRGAPAVAIGATVRYAIQVATHLGSSGSRAVLFEHAAAATTSGHATLDVDVTDAGGRGYRPTLWAEVYDAQGALRAKGRQVRGLLYPGTSLHQHFDFGVLPTGTYKILLFADTGDASVFAAQYSITL